MNTTLKRFLILVGIVIGVIAGKWFLVLIGKADAGLGAEMILGPFFAAAFALHMKATDTWSIDKEPARSTSTTKKGKSGGGE